MRAQNKCFVQFRYAANDLEELKKHQIVSNTRFLTLLANEDGSYGVEKLIFVGSLSNVGPRSEKQSTVGTIRGRLDTYSYANTSTQSRRHWSNERQ